VAVDSHCLGSVGEEIREREGKSRCSCLSTGCCGCAASPAAAMSIAIAPTRRRAKHGDVHDPT
jgi:hypothetical protein